MLVQLQQFEGPLGLLLFLIRKEEMDIYDIPIHKITSQYLSHIKQLPKFDLEQAGDFVAMAATLIQIKARMLLPNYDEDGQELEEEDPRQPLVQQLLEYQKYQDASRELYERDILGRDTWQRGRKEDLVADDAGIELEESALFSLIGSYRSVVRSAANAKHTVSAKFQTIASRILEISSRIKPGIKTSLRELMKFDEWTTTRFLMTFLSTLELGKLGYVKISQVDDCGDIYIEGKSEISGDVVARVAEYDDGNPSELSATDTVAEEVVAKEIEPVFEDEIASDHEIKAAEFEMAGLELPVDLSGDFESDGESTGLDIDALNQTAANILENGGLAKAESDSELESSAELAEASEEVLTIEDNKIMDTEA